VSAGLRAGVALMTATRLRTDTGGDARAGRSEVLR
jgi:hypothetical protein